MKNIGIPDTPASSWWRSPTSNVTPPTAEEMIDIHAAAADPAFQAWLQSQYGRPFGNFGFRPQNPTGAPMMGVRSPSSVSQRLIYNNNLSQYPLRTNLKTVGKDVAGVAGAYEAGRLMRWMMEPKVDDSKFKFK